jgi:hypothetical protein
MKRKVTKIEETGLNRKHEKETEYANNYRQQMRLEDVENDKKKLKKTGRNGK